MTNEKNILDIPVIRLRATIMNYIDDEHRMYTQTRAREHESKYIDVRTYIYSRYYHQNVL